MGRFQKTLEKIIHIYNLALYMCGTICLVGFILSTIYQVIARNTLPRAPIWTEEASRFLFIYMVAFGVGIAVHSNEYVGVELLVDLLPRKAQKIYQIVVMLAIAAFCFWYFSVSTLKFAIFDYTFLSPAMGLPMQLVYKSMIILFPSLGFSYILAALLRAVKKD